MLRPESICKLQTVSSGAHNVVKESFEFLSRGPFWAFLEPRLKDLQTLCRRWASASSTCQGPLKPLLPGSESVANPSKEYQNAWKELSFQITHMAEREIPVGSPVTRGSRPDPLINAAQPHMLFTGIRSSAPEWNLGLGPGNVRRVNLSLERLLQHRGCVQSSLPITSSRL